MQPSNKEDSLNTVSGEIIIEKSSEDKTKESSLKISEEVMIGVQVSVND